MRLLSLWLPVAAALFLFTSPVSAAQLLIISQTSKFKDIVDTTYFGPVDEFGNQAFLRTYSVDEQFDVLQPGVRQEISGVLVSISAWVGIGSGSGSIEVNDRIYIDVVEDFLLPRSYLHRVNQAFSRTVDYTWSRSDDDDRQVTFDFIPTSFDVDLGEYGSVLVDFDAYQYQCHTGCAGGAARFYYTWTPIPEPTTALLLAGGLVGIAALRRRRQT